jgi:hypothetical protein
MSSLLVDQRRRFACELLLVPSIGGGVSLLLFRPFEPLRELLDRTAKDFRAVSAPTTRFAGEPIEHLERAIVY